MATEPWRKPPADLVERFHAAVVGLEGVEIRKMFGFPAAFVAGNMVAGVHQESVMVRLAESERQARLADGWALFEPMPGRPMREYVALPAEVVGDVNGMRGWIERAADYVRTLPPKNSKARRTR